MATNLPVRSDKDQNRTRNKKAIDIAIPFVFRTVLNLGCPKDDDESYLHYYERRPEKIWVVNKDKWEREMEIVLEKRTKTWTDENKKKEEARCRGKLKQEKLKKYLVKEIWSDDEKQKLSEKTCEDLDATLLHKLIPTICDDIDRYNPKALSQTKIELFLKKIRDIRNDICHEPTGGSVSPTIIDDLEEAGVNVLEAAGQLYGTDQQTVTQKIAEFKTMLQEFKEEVMTDEHRRIQQTAKILSDEGMAEVQKVGEQQASDHLPFGADKKVSLTDVFHTVNLSMTEDDRAQSKNAEPEDQKVVEFPSTELLHCNDSDVILCEGEPGSGKTTLLRRLRKDFFAKGANMFPGLNKFDLLLYMDCRDNTLETILQLLKRTFPTTMNLVNDQEALQALHELRLLICVDGLDELNQNSRRLLDELIRTFQGHGKAKFVCTSRPGQSDSLRTIKYHTLSLQPITKEEEQIVFLGRYQTDIKGIDAPELIQAFKSLDQFCKDCLRQPIYLALFCYLFLKFGQKVCLWKNELEIMNHILALSEQTMVDRMKTMKMENCEDYAEDVTKAIACLSIKLVHKEEVTIDRKTYRALCAEIFGKAEVPHYSVLSSFFTKHTDGQSFNFFHKSYLEFLAAKQLYSCLEAQPSASAISTIETQSLHSNQSDAAAPGLAVTDEQTVSLRRFDNVFRFCAMMFVDGGSSKKRALTAFVDEVCPALAKEQVGVSYWVELTLCCPGSEEVAKAAAKAAKTVSEAMPSHKRAWRVQTNRDMAAVRRMLCYHQPALLDIRPLRSEGVPAELRPLLETVTRCHTGLLNLYLQESFFTFSAIDDLVICLESARCTLGQFLGCIGPSREARQVLTAAVRKSERTGVAPALNVSLTHPRQHQLEGLEGTSHRLFVLAQLNPNEASQRCPLPRSSARPPILIFNCRLVTKEAVTSTASLIEDLVPDDKQYCSLGLLQWQGNDAELQELLQRLRAAGVTTEDTGSLRWVPLRTSRDGRCSGCLSLHQAGWGRCVGLIVPEQDPRDAAGLTQVVTDDDMRMVASLLPLTPFPWLEVITLRSAPPPPALGPLMKAVAKWHQGKLDVKLGHSYRGFVPADDLLAPLHSARCQLVTFRGCLSGSNDRALQALVEGVKRTRQGVTTELNISLLWPRQHKLRELDGTRHDLVIRVRLPSSPGDRHRRPLPTSSFRAPALVVEFPPAAGDGAPGDEETRAGLATALIEDLAPWDMTYFAVHLQHFPDTDSALDEIVAQLSTGGVRTVSGNTTSWCVVGKDSDGDCMTCLESSHRPGERCVLLLLA